jgi:hypothetical protein
VKEIEAHDKGSRTLYKAGCRCRLCIDSQTEYGRQWRSRQSHPQSNQKDAWSERAVKVLELRSLGMSYKDIGEQLGITPVNARSIVCRYKGTIVYHDGDPIPDVMMTSEQAYDLISGQVGSGARFFKDMENKGSFIGSDDVDGLSGVVVAVDDDVAVVKRTPQQIHDDAIRAANPNQQRPRPLDVMVPVDEDVTMTGPGGALSFS